MHTQPHSVAQLFNLGRTSSCESLISSVCRKTAKNADSQELVPPRFWLHLARALALGVVFMVPGYSVAGGVKAGDSFPDLAGFKLEGKLPEATKGKVILVDFWASWCEPCKQSFPVMEELHKRYADRGLVIIAVNVDENRPDMEAFLKKNSATFVVLRDPNQKLVEKTGIATMPSSFLLDRDGKVRFAHTGFRGAETKKKYEEEIETLLK